MTRDELIDGMAGEIAMRLVTTGDYGRDTAEALATEYVDKYAAAQRAEIEQQIAEHVQMRLRAERERIAQAIISRTPSPKLVGGFMAGERVGMQRAARIARAES